MALSWSALQSLGDRINRQKRILTEGEHYCKTLNELLQESKKEKQLLDSKIENSQVTIDSYKSRINTHNELRSRMQESAGQSQERVSQMILTYQGRRLENQQLNDRISTLTSKHEKDMEKIKERYSDAINDASKSAMREMRHKKHQLQLEIRTLETNYLARNHAAEWLVWRKLCISLANFYVNSKLCERTPERRGETLQAANKRNWDFQQVERALFDKEGNDFGEKNTSSTFTGNGMTKELTLRAHQSMDNQTLTTTQVQSTGNRLHTIYSSQSQGSFNVNQLANSKPSAVYQHVTSNSSPRSPITSEYFEGPAVILSRTDTASVEAPQVVCSNQSNSQHSIDSQSFSNFENNLREGNKTSYSHSSDHRVTNLSRIDTSVMPKKNIQKDNVRTDVQSQSNVNIPSLFEPTSHTLSLEVQHPSESIPSFVQKTLAEPTSNDQIHFRDTQITAQSDIHSTASDSCGMKNQTMTMQQLLLTKDTASSRSETPSATASYRDEHNFSTRQKNPWDQNEHESMTLSPKNTVSSELESNASHASFRVSEEVSNEDNINFTLMDASDDEMENEMEKGMTTEERTQITLNLTSKAEEKGLSKFYNEKPPGATSIFENDQSMDSETTAENKSLDSHSFERQFLSFSLTTSDPEPVSYESSPSASKNGNEALENPFRLSSSPNILSGIKQTQEIRTDSINTYKTIGEKITMSKNAESSKSSCIALQQQQLFYNDNTASTIPTQEERQAYVKTLLTTPELHLFTPKVKEASVQDRPSEDPNKKSRGKNYIQDEVIGESHQLSIGTDVKSKSPNKDTQTTELSQPTDRRSSLELKRPNFCEDLQTILNSDDQQPQKSPSISSPTLNMTKENNLRSEKGPSLGTVEETDHNTDENPNNFSFHLFNSSPQIPQTPKTNAFMSLFGSPAGSPQGATGGGMASLFDTQPPSRSMFGTQAPNDEDNNEGFQHPFGGFCSPDPPMKTQNSFFSMFNTQVSSPEGSGDQGSASFKLF